MSEIMDLFNDTATSAVKERYALVSGTTRVDTCEVLDNGTTINGRAFAGKDRNGDVFACHQVGKSTVAVRMYAVSALVSGGGIPATAIAAGFFNAGNLDALKKAITAVEKAAKDAAAAE